MISGHPEIIAAPLEKAEQNKRHPYLVVVAIVLSSRVQPHEGIFCCEDEKLITDYWS